MTWHRGEHEAASLYPVPVIAAAVVASAVLVTTIALLSAQTDSHLRYTFDFEGGRRGTEINTSDSDSGEPFDTVFEDEVTNTATYGDTFTADGALSGLFTFDDADDPFSALGWKLPASSEYFIRVIGRIDHAGAGIQAGFDDSEFLNNISVAMDAGTAAWIIGNDMETIDTAATRFEAGDVFRFDMHVVADPGDGLVEARIWRNEISDSDPYEEIGSAGLDTGTEWDNAFFSVGSHTDHRVVVSIDALEVNDFEWPSFAGS